MNKNERLSLIANLIQKNSAGRLEASASEVVEEKNLALANQTDESILDEEDKDSFVNPVLAANLDNPRSQREGEEESILSKREMAILSRELGRPVSFLGVKRAEEKGESFELSLTNEEIAETVAWAEKQAAS